MSKPGCFCWNKTPSHDISEEKCDFSYLVFVFTAKVYNNSYSSNKFNVNHNIKCQYLLNGKKYILSEIKTINFFLI